MKDDRLYLIHISECIERIKRIFELDLQMLKRQVDELLEELGGV